MTAFRRISVCFPILLVAFAMSMVASGSAMAAGGEQGCDETPENPTGQCPPAATPAPAPAEAQAPVDVCPEVAGLQSESTQCLPDEAPAPGLDIETSSLTIQEVQHDPPAIVGGQHDIIPVSSVTTVSGGGAVTTPTGNLPYTGLSIAHIGVIGGSLLVFGSLSWFVAGRTRRMTSDAA
jgi:hypothetical protein